MLPEEFETARLPANASPVVLLAEDEVLIRLGIADYLRSCGCVVHEAHDLAEAKAVLLAGMPIDVVFTDMNMPNSTDGLQLGQWLFDHYPAVAVIVTSGIAQTMQSAAALCANVHHTVLKPYAYEAVYALMLQSINQRRAGV
jgi:DNA-binding NtrC family response regulator